MAAKPSTQPIVQAASPAIDPIQQGIAAGWKVIDAGRLDKNLKLEFDVVVVGSGAGGGVTAEILASAGLSVLVVEEGPLKSSSDFKMREREAYPQLYLESAGRRTKDKGVIIMQGRSVGGSTTVNWTSSFRTPPRTLAFWREAHGLKGFGETDLEPWFARMEEQLSIAPWPVPPNQNNDVLALGCAALNVPSAAIRRNVKGCWNLGYCGMGCPTNAKQSMLVTTIPSALGKGATLLHRARVLKLERAGNRISGCEIAGLPGAGVAPGAWRVHVRARHFVISAGAIGSPALLLRSELPDPYGTLGKRTFLHPSVISAAILEKDVDAWSGAPQTVYSDHFLDSVALEGPIGYKLEVAPMHPILAGITLPGFGKSHQAWMSRLPKMQVSIALMRDGFSPQSPGGKVQLLDDGSPVLDYPLDDFLWDGARRAYASMAEIQFAGGAKIVMPMHEDAPPYRNWAEAKAGIAALPMGLLRTSVASAHVMGGCAMGNDPRTSVVDERGRYHAIDNLSVHDGSLFPTSVGANPQLSIYAIVARMAVGLAGALTKTGTA